MSICQVCRKPIRDDQTIIRIATTDRSKAWFHVSCYKLRDGVTELTLPPSRGTTQHQLHAMHLKADGDL
jgi:recombinational DNA repair protein RecR